VFTSSRNGCSRCAKSALNAPEARIRVIKAAPEAIELELRRYEAEARSRMELLADALERRPKEARAILSAIFGGKLTATPLVDRHGPRFIVEGDASVGKMLAYECEPEGGSLEIHPRNSRPQRGMNVGEAIGAVLEEEELLMDVRVVTR
jgi:hypothetical protein